MPLFLFAAVLLSVTDQLWADEICCPGLRCYDDNPPFFGWSLPQCPEKMGINMKVYTRQNPKTGQTTTRDKIPSSFKAELMTMFIVHGWLQNEETTWTHDMKDTVLAQGDYNVIIVGWRDGAKHLWYPQSASNTRTVGGEIALVAKNMITNGKSSKALMYCVGASLGAHVCGHAGQQGQFGRITGLDPAGPGFLDCDSSVGLNPSCADLVDVIHTDGGWFGLGMLKAVGHIDFYPNRGSHQPGCGLNRFSDSMDALENYAKWEDRTNDSCKQSTADERIHLPVGCNHARAVHFFGESIRTPCFLSRQSCSNQYLLPISCTKNKDPVQSMGFNANAYPGRGIFYLETNADQPHCRN